MKKYFLLFILFLFFSSLNAQSQFTPHDTLIGQNSNSPKEINEKSPWLAFGLSYLLPGLGQVYNGEVGKGFLFMGGVVAGVGIMVLSAGDGETESSVNKTLLYSGLTITAVFELWQLIDAPVSASRINRENRMRMIGKEIEAGISFDEEKFFFNIIFHF